MTKPYKEYQVSYTVTQVYLVEALDEEEAFATAMESDPMHTEEECTVKLLDNTTE